MRITNLLLLLAFVVAGCLGARDGFAADYKIGPQDKLRIKVYEWPALSDEVLVSDNGTISLPIVESIKAAGHSTTELARMIAGALQERVSLPELPHASVEVSQFRPFYIDGEVQRPGEYPYRPGLTVLMAVSIAGGRYRPTEMPNRPERDTIQSRGNLVVALAKQREVRVRAARLRAELEGKDDFSVEPLPGDGEELSEMVQQERAILRSRISAHQNQVAGLRQQIEIGSEEVRSLRARIESAAKQQRSVERELASLKGLSDRGLLLAPRQTTLERLSAQIEGDQRDIEARIAQVRQSMAQSETAIAKLTDDQQREIGIELRTASALLDELEQQIGMHRRLLEEAESFAGLVGLSNSARKIRLSYRITRVESGASREFPVEGHDRVEPGDVVTVDQGAAEGPLASEMPRTAPGGVARRTQ